MPNFTLNIHCDNDAFFAEYDDPMGTGESFSPSPEIARILRAVANRVESGEDYGHFLTIFDVNGNDVGRFALQGDQGEPISVHA